MSSSSFLFYDPAFQPASLFLSFSPLPFFFLFFFFFFSPISVAVRGEKQPRGKLCFGVNPCSSVRGASRFPLIMAVIEIFQTHHALLLFISLAFFPLKFPQKDSFSHSRISVFFAPLFIFFSPFTLAPLSCASSPFPYRRSLHFSCLSS